MFKLIKEIYNLKKLIKAGSKRAVFDIGMVYNGLHLKSKYLKFIKKAAELGDSRAQNQLGLYYDSIEESKKAVEWFEKAIETDNNREAMYDLGAMYYFGTDSFMRDKKIAFQWFEKAADLGSPEAQLGLASLYFFGEGVEKDEAKAAKFAKMAANSGNSRAIKFWNKRNLWEYE